MTVAWIYAIDIKVYCNDQATLDAIVNAIPPVEDSRVRGEEYEGPIQYVDDVTGHRLLTASIKFDNATDRDEIEADLFENQGLFNTCKAGTKIKRRNSDHSNQDVVDRQGCYDTIIFEVV